MLRVRVEEELIASCFKSFLLSSYRKMNCHLSKLVLRVSACLAVTIICCSGGVTRPNIIFIVADDAGWNDFSFHGSHQIPTPNIDAIGLNGIILNSYYSAPLCTPSRGATLTGKYPIYLGLQHYVITGGLPTGLPLSEKLLPEYLKELGYGTHLVGKWHLGSARKVFTPTLRGFDSHFGYYLGKQDYYSHVSREQYGVGYDFRRNLSVDYSVFGKYSTDVYTEEALRIIEQQPEDEPLFLMIAHTAPHSSYEAVPLQAPEENVDKFSETIEDEGRRRYAGVVDKLDESIGDVMLALANKKMLGNSIVIFVSDNGGAPGGYDLNQGSNWPLRGMKNTLWEGGTRLAACMWSPLLSSPQVSKHMMHSVDWLPTLLAAAGGDITQLEYLDGVSQWSYLTGSGPPPRNSFLYNIDPIRNSSGVRYKNWKLIEGNNAPNDLGPCPDIDCGGWFGPTGEDEETASNATANQVHSGVYVKKILDSGAAKAFEMAGHPMDGLRVSEIQNDAKVVCPGSEIIACDTGRGPCLYDIDADPCEKRNLANQEPEVVEFMRNFLEEFNKTAVRPIKRWNDPNSAPSKWNYTWTFFKDFEDDLNSRS